MPTYEYKCDACGHDFEEFQSITAAPIKKCPKCGKNKVRRLIGTGGGMIFKGSGFYITDYRDASYGEKAKAESGTSSESSSSSSSDGKSGESAKSEPAKADAKPAAPAKAEKPAAAAPKPAAKASSGGKKK